MTEANQDAALPLGVNLKELAMPDTIVGIDVETTSLDPWRGDIIEVAAIRFKTATFQELERFTALCRPRHPLSLEISRLTGITTAMLKDSLPFSDHREKLKDFIGDDLIFAHNIFFDRNFLESHGLPLPNAGWDTFLLAGIAWPEAHSYNLGTLAAEQGIEIGREHRAARDVELSAQLLHRIQTTLTVSESLYDQIKLLLGSLNHSHYLPLFTINKSSGSPKMTELPEAQPSQKGIPELPKVFGSKGVFTRSLSAFRHRENQLKMAQAIENAFHTGKTALIEAGTGIGKTYAYTVPALRLALQQKSQPLKILIATYTKALQDQIMHHDLPQLQKVFQTRLKTASLKGRRNYICFERLQHRLTKPLSESEVWAALKLLMWLEKGGSGDLEMVNFSHLGTSLISQLHADSIVCRTTCTRSSPCPYQKARQKAENARLIITNHALLAQWPEQAEDSQYAAIIVDEGHHVASALRSAQKIDFSLDRLDQVLDLIIQATAPSKKISSKTHQHLKEEGDEILRRYRELLQKGYQFVVGHSSSDRLRLSSSTRQNTAWKHLEQEIHSLVQKLQFTTGLAKGLPAQQVSRDRFRLLSESIQEMELFTRELARFAEGSSSRIQWIEAKKTSLIAELMDLPLDIRPFMTGIRAKTESLILTSATLKVKGEFSFTKQSLGLEDALEYTFPAPFIYKDQMQIYITEDAPNPASPNFIPYTAALIAQISQKIQGRMLILCTSHTMVKELYQMAIRMLNKAPFSIYAQGITGSRYNIAKRFKERAESILIGTSSFWEGFDVPGEGLSCVCIPRLPFTPPDDPVMQSLIEFSQHHQSPGKYSSGFEDVVLPHMIIQLRQGIGRLIRSENDKGLLVICDPRIIARPYGRNVIQSLPSATIRMGAGSEVIASLEDWFGKDTLTRWGKDIPTSPE